ncbi:MAG: hypothetical protein IKD14_00190 [Clostridia bacterium]|nr:hypothetical protein [Clostridia bacterium]MBR7135527.1 hypothetical protein [Clostridia bacterium]
MKDFCVGLALGMSLGVLLSVNKKEIKELVREGEKVAMKKIKKAKKQLESLSDDEEAKDEE